MNYGCKNRSRHLFLKDNTLGGQGDEGNVQNG
jgi:hypothetical protein